MKKLFLFLSILSISPYAQAKKCPIKAKYTLTMEQALERAYTHKPSVQAFDHAITAAKRQQKGKLSSFIPNVSLSETLYDNDTNSKAESAFGISANQTLINLATHDAYRIAGKTVTQNKLFKESHKNDIRKQVELSFLSAWLQQQKVKYIAWLYRSAKYTFEQDKHKNALDLYNKNDWLKTNVTYSSNLTEMRSYSDDVAIAQQTLSYYTGTPTMLIPASALHPKLETTKISWIPKKQFDLAPRQTYYYRALAYRPEIKQYENTIETESLQSSFYAKKYVPSVSLYAAGAKSTMRTAKSQWSHEAGLKVSWNIFDGAANYFEKSAADARKLKAMLEKNDAVAKIKLEVHTAYATLQKEIKKLETYSVAHHQEHNEYVLKKQEYKIGSISSVDFEQARFKWEKAKFDWYAQVVATAQKEHVLDYACGYPLVV